MLLCDSVPRTNECTFYYYNVREVTLFLYTLIARMYNMFTSNLKNRKFMVLIEHDIRFIAAKHHPKSSVTSTTWHMCTAYVDAHGRMKAVELEEDDTKNHHNIQVTMQDGTVQPCRRHPTLPWFCMVESRNYYHQGFLQNLLLHFKELNLSSVNKSFQELR